VDCMADVLMGFHRSTFSKPNTELNSVHRPRYYMCDINDIRDVALFPPLTVSHYTSITLTI
jgi:hypothetical protein